MKATLTTLAVIVVLTSYTASTRASQDAVRRVLPEEVLTGCIVQGSGPTVLIFDNAKKDPNSAGEKGERYVLTEAPKDVDLRKHLNHAMRITGEVDLKVSAMPDLDPVPSDPNRPVNERTLPRLIVRSVTMVSDKCSGR